ncbi:hypothetical protein ACNQFZ_12605 [Schinkia sp. CFF1]
MDKVGQQKRNRVRKRVPNGQGEEAKVKSSPQAGFKRTRRGGKRAMESARELQMDKVGWQKSNGVRKRVPNGQGEEAKVKSSP